MFREMRRKKQQLSEKESIEILEKGSTGVLAVLGDDGYPYAVPLNYVYRDGKLFFHCAKTGHKLDAIRRCEKVSFCVVDRDQVVSEKYTTYFRSVITFGRAHILETDQEKQEAVLLLLGKYCPQQKEKWQETIDREGKAVCVIEVIIEHMTGKQAVELVNND